MSKYGLSRKELDVSTSQLGQPASHVQIHFHQPLLPSVIHLTGYVGFSDRPLIEKFLQSILIPSPITHSCIVLDFSGVIAIETCFATFLARQAHKLSLRSPEVHLYFAGIKNGSNLYASLSQNELHCSWSHDDLGQNPQAPGEVRRIAKNLAFDSMEQALHTYRYANGGGVGMQFMSLSHALDQGQENTFIDNFIGELKTYLPRLDLPLQKRMSRYGLVLRKLVQGQAVACGRYDTEPVFIVLQGEVMIHQSHNLTPKASAPQPVREAICTAVKSVPQLARRLVRQKEEPEDIVPSQCLTSLDIYDQGSRFFTCAHAVGPSCWILDIHPQNRTDLLALHDLAKKACGTKC
jgi:hypothetical protein